MKLGIERSVDYTSAAGYGSAEWLDGLVHSAYILIRAHDTVLHAACVHELDKLICPTAEISVLSRLFSWLEDWTGPLTPHPFA
jgi:hypothetical protein